MDVEYLSIHIVSSFPLISGSINLQKILQEIFQFFPPDYFEFLQQSAIKIQNTLVKEGAHDERKAAPRAGVRGFSLQG